MFIAEAKRDMSDSEVLEFLRLMKESPLSFSAALDPQSELNALDKRIHSLEQVPNVVLEGLHRNRAFLTSRLERRRAMYAPIRLLPRDVLT